MRWIESMIAKITKLQDIATRHGNGRIAKAYNANLGYGIIETKNGKYQLFNEYGYVGEKPTLSMAVTEYQEIEAAHYGIG